MHHNPGVVRAIVSEDSPHIYREGGGPSRTQNIVRSETVGIFHRLYRIVMCPSAWRLTRRARGD